MKHSEIAVSVLVFLVLTCWSVLKLDLKSNFILENKLRNLTSAHQNSTKELPPWHEGLLDIHHLFVGSSVSTFAVLPDGTTILIDAGEIDVKKQRKWWDSLGPPFDEMEALNPFPNDSKTPPEWILDYVATNWPETDARNSQRRLDYVLVTHFHGDHIGSASKNMPLSPNGHYRMSGMKTIANNMTARTWIDRGYPDYNFPRNLAKVKKDKDVQSYISFIKEMAQNGSTVLEQFQVGSTRQIALQHKPDLYPDFQIQVLKSSADVMLPSSRFSRHLPEKVSIPGEILNEKGKWNENTMSAAILLRYADFRYYEGGDQEIITHKDGYVAFDTISPTSKAAGKVDVASLNHHGHGINPTFLQEMDPRHMILQGWCSDQPHQESMELIWKASKGDNKQIFATYIFPKRLKALGPSLSQLFASTSGHVVVRVYPKKEGEEQSYEIFVLNGDLKIKSHHGPFTTSQKPN